MNKYHQKIGMWSLLEKKITVCRQPRVDFCVKKLPPKTHGLPIGPRLKIPGRKALVKEKTKKKINNFDPALANLFTIPEKYWKTYHPSYKSTSRIVKMRPDEFLNLCADFTISGVDRSGESKYDREVRRVALVRKNMERLSAEKQKTMKDVGGVMQLIVQELNETDVSWVKNAYQNAVTGFEYNTKPAGERLFVVEKHFGRHRALDFKLQGESSIGVKVTVLKRNSFVIRAIHHSVLKRNLPPERITVGDCLLREPTRAERKQKQYTPNYLLEIKASSI